MADMKRSAGILLHPTSLPSRYAIGDFGPTAFAFVDFLAQARVHVWAVLPLTIPDMTGSPYASVSAHALTWLCVSPDQLVHDGLLPATALPRSRPTDNVSYATAYHQRRTVLKDAFSHFQKNGSPAHHRAVRQFIRRESYWLTEYATFMAIKQRYHDMPWFRWPRALAEHRSAELRHWRARHAREIAFFEFEQWVTQSQWLRLKGYAHRQGVSIFGDIPFFVTHDSVDVWAHQNQFLLNKKHLPITIAGVPPDYFGRRGQIWDNPHYNWQVMQKNHFHWWISRFRRASRLYDLTRVDHFRGFDTVWHIPFGARTARRGSWEPVPGHKLLTEVRRRVSGLSIVAEDLGTITPTVATLRKKFGLPSMRVLQFSFSGFPDNTHMPKNFRGPIVAYTGTHDNDTSRGWFTTSSTSDERWLAGERLRADEHTFAQKLIAYGMATRAQLFIVPLQDILNLGSEARMNKPGTKRGNWRWRFQPHHLHAEHAQRLARLIRITGRGHAI